MKKMFYPIIAMGLLFMLPGCKKSIADAEHLLYEPSLGPAPIRIIPPLGPRTTASCVPDRAYFYANVWALANGPTQSCPFYLSDQVSVKVTFTDGTFIFCEPTFMDQFGNIGYGGAGLQDLNCTAPMFGFLNYMDLHYFEPGGHGAQSDASFPLYGCNSGNASAAYPIIFKRGVNYYMTYSSNNIYYYSERGQYLHKTIQLIEFI